MSIAEMVWGGATIFFMAFMCIVLRFDISNLKDKISDLEFKLDHKLTSLTKAEEKDGEQE